MLSGIEGVTENKSGDHCTPVGKYKFEKVYYRAEKLDKIDFLISSDPISKQDGWCDDPNSKYYNQFIKFPFAGSAEKLYREDELYDIVCVLNYNTKPIVHGKGSAIFMHVCKNDFAPTEGCIAVKKEVLIEISKKITSNSTILIEN